MRYKLVVPWTARLPLSRWIRRRSSTFDAVVAEDTSAFKAPADIEKH